ncbi:MAG: hypothetical protein ABJP34_03905 [Erythrobacter sp.]
MAIRTQIILWATGIITLALFLQSSDLSNGASLGIIAGLSGAAMGTISSSKARKRCK